MAFDLGEGILDVLPRTTAFASELTRQLQPALERAGSQLKSTGTRLTHTVTAPLIGVGIAMVKLASDEAEIQNVTDTTFGKMSKDISAWSDTAIDRLGIASSTAENMANRFGLLFKAAKLPGPEIVGLSEKFAQLTVDSSSFFNVSFDVALEKIRSGLAGESEPLRDFGILLNEAAVQQEAVRLGLVRANQELTEQQKIVARASLIQKGLNDASGDYARTQDSTANSTRRATEELKQLGAEFGADLLPVARDALDVAHGLLEGFQDLSPESRELALKLGLVAIAAGPVVRLFGSIVSLGASAVRILSNMGTTAGSSAPGIAANAQAIGANVKATVAWAAAIPLVGIAADKTIREMQRSSDEADTWAAALEAGKFTVEELDAAVRDAAAGGFGFADMASDTELWNARNRAVAQYQAHIDELGAQQFALSRSTLTSQDAFSSWSGILTQNTDISKRQETQLGRALNALSLYDDELTDSERAAISNLIQQGHFASALELVNRNIDDGVKHLRHFQTAHERAAEATADHDVKVQALGSDIRHIEGPHHVDVGVKITGADRLAGIAAQLAALEGQHDISVDFRGGGGHALAAGGILGGTVPAGASGFIATQPVLVGEGTSPTPFGRGAEAVVPFDDRGIGILADALGLAMTKMGGGGGGMDQDTIDRFAAAVGRQVARHTHTVELSSHAVGRAVESGQRRDRMVRG